MMIEGLDRVQITKLISQQVEQVTCIECCKYFIAPETAGCGHSLCHSCWKGRHVCHTCAAPVEKKALRVNLPLQTLTDHIHSLADSFEKLFNVKLEEITLDILDELQTQDPTKNVKEWLANSDNHFSAPVVSQTSEPELPHEMEVSKNKIQIHSSNNKTKSPEKVVKPPQPQEDWDKIEVLPDTEGEICGKPKENIVPMDLEPFLFDENDYSNDNPRRSARKRDLKTDANPPCDGTTDKNSNFSTETKSLKNKQTWNTVKKMRKEFSKLNKKNKSKLNVSIEMCKKGQAASKSKQAQKLPQPADSEKTDVIIDDKTQQFSQSEQRAVLEQRTTNNNDNYNAAKELPEVFKRHGSNTQINLVDEDNKSPDKNKSTKSINDNPAQPKSSSDSLSKINKSTISTVHFDHYVTKNQHMPFIKKSALHQKCTSVKQDHVQISQKEVEANTTNVINADDIEISIKIGSTITNIVIINKRNDVQLKVNTDKEIQTSPEPKNVVSKADANCSPMTGYNIQNIELNINANNKVEVHKTISTKKNTASADTAPITGTAQFDITDSMERELSNVMEHLERKRIRTVLSGKTAQPITEKQPLPSPQTSNVVKKVSPVTDNMENTTVKTSETTYASESSASVAAPKTSQEKKDKKVENKIQEEIDNLNDIDIFNSGSVKEANVKHPSEILLPTFKSKKSQMNTDKRKRESIDDVEMHCTKKQKTSFKAITEDKDKIIKTVNLGDDVQNDSEPMNYDVIMSQVFANIDADMNRSTIKNFSKTQGLKSVANECEILNRDTPVQTSQIIHRTQKKPTHKDISVIVINNDSKEDQKFSENVFSIIEKESQPLDVKKTDDKISARVTTQQHIEALLTPGACRDLAHSRPAHTQLSTHTHVDTHTQLSMHTQADTHTYSQGDKHTQIDTHIDENVLIQGTPVVDNDDVESVVEETPQKEVSMTKPKQSNETLKTMTSGEKLQKHNLENLRNLENNAKDLQINKSIIDISDTTLENVRPKSSLAAMAREKMASKDLALETPVTINKFVNHIKYNSTPVARKSLNFDSNIEDDGEDTLCPTTTQEKQFLADAFKRSQVSPVKRVLSLSKMFNKPAKKKFFVAGSCLSSMETKNIKLLCQEQGWMYLDKYTDELTHLVVGVDEENKSQRSVKYMCALAASKWIVSYAWIQKCIQSKTAVDEWPYEVLDACGEPGPKRSRTAVRKVFEGITFYCMPPFSVLNIDSLKMMLSAAGGRVVGQVEQARVTAESCARVALLLAEPETTQEDRFMFLAVDAQVVPVNYEWALNCLGSYTICSIADLLLCPLSLLRAPIAHHWPPELLQEDDY